MKSKLRSTVGVVLMTGCGSYLAKHLGLQGVDYALFFGLVIGCGILGQAPWLEQRTRLDQLEARLKAMENTAQTSPSEPN